MLVFFGINFIFSFFIFCPDFIFGPVFFPYSIILFRILFLPVKLAVALVVLVLRVLLWFGLVPLAPATAELFDRVEQALTWSGMDDRLRDVTRVALKRRTSLAVQRTLPNHPREACWMCSGSNGKATPE